MLLYPIIRSLTREDGSDDRSAVARLAVRLHGEKVATGVVVMGALTFTRTRNRTWREALDEAKCAAAFEREDVAGRITRNAAYEAKLAAEERSAQAIADRFDLNADRLQFEVDRLFWGNSSSRCDLPLYQRALAIAREPQRRAA